MIKVGLTYLTYQWTRQNKHSLTHILDVIKAEQTQQRFKSRFSLWVIVDFLFLILGFVHYPELYLSLWATRGIVLAQCWTDGSSTHTWPYICELKPFVRFTKRVVSDNATGKSIFVVLLLIARVIVVIKPWLNTVLLIWLVDNCESKQCIVYHTTFNICKQLVTVLLLKLMAEAHSFTFACR